MHLRGRRLKFTAVAVLVVLSLTGFSSGRHGHGRKSDGGSGGGCSSSSQNHDSSSSTTSGGGTYHDYDDDDYDDSYDDASADPTDGDYSTVEDAEVELVTCATRDAPYATIEVTNPNAKDGTFYASVTFKDANGDTLDEQGVEVRVSWKSVATAKVELSDDLVGKVDHCEADPLAKPAA